MKITSIYFFKIILYFTLFLKTVKAIFCSQSSKVMLDLWKYENQKLRKMTLSHLSVVADSTPPSRPAPADKAPLDYKEPAAEWTCSYSFGHGVLGVSTWKGEREEGRRTHSPLSLKYGLYELHVWHPCCIFVRGR